jgi:glucose-1-phosphate cytidylyltransferase
VKIVLLCGGLGTRLREETEFRPKPLVEVGDRPVVWHIMKHFAHFGFTEFVLCLGYRSSMIKEYFLNYEAMNNDFTLRLGRTRELEYHGAHDESDFQVTLVDTGLATQTGGRVRRVRRFLDGDTFLVTYGDGIADVDVGELVAFHRRHGRLATMTTVRPTSRYGIVDVGAAGEVVQFAEKPSLDGWINAGFFVFERPVLEYLGGDGCVLEREPLERLTKDGQLMAFRHYGFFMGMDTYREQQILDRMWERGEAPWKVWA